MTLELLSPNKTLFNGIVKLVQVPGSKGSFEILKNHEPIVSTLEKGKIKVILPEGKNLFFEIERGFIELKNNKINILVT